MDFDFVLPPDSASKAQHDRVLDKNLLDSLRSFFNTSLSEIFEDGTTVRPRSTSCPRSVGVAAARRQIAKGDPGGGPDPAVAPSSAARPRQLRSRPSQNERGAAKPKLVVSRGKQQPSLVVGSPIDELKPVKTQMSSHPQRDLRRSETKFESPVRHRHGSRQSSEQGALSSTTSSLPESPSSPGAVMTDVLSSVVNSFSTIGAKATNLLNTLDANFDQMFNVEGFDANGHVDMLLTEAQHSQLQQELHKQEQKQTHLMVPTASETMTRETRQRAEPLPKADAPWSPDNDTAVDRAIGANKRMENQKRQKAKVAALSPSMINVPINRKHGEKQTGRKECNAAQPGPTTPTPHHALNGDACSPGSEQDFPRDQASRNRKIRIITPAGASQEARLQSETSHLRSENELLVSRIATLAAENERLRSDPVDLAVTCQLKKVLAEKAQLVEENAMLMRENRSLHELLAFTTDYQGLLEGSPVPSNGLPASLDGVSARMHYTTGEGVTDGLPPLTPAANGSLSDETLALDSYYSNFLPLSTSACGWDFMEMDMDMGDGSLPVQGGALGSAVQADDRSAGSTGSGQGSASESAGTATECGIRSNLAAEWDIHGAAGSIVITPRVITPRHPSRLGSSEASRSLDGGHVITPHVITPRDPSHLGNSEASRSLDSGSVITPVLGIYCPVICPFGSSEASRSLDGGSVITPCDPSHLGSSGASRSPVGGSHDDEDSMRSRASSTGGDQGTIDEAWVELDCTTSSTSYRPARGPAASESMHIPAAIQGSSPSSLPSSPNVNSYVMLSALDDVIDCKH